MVVDVEVKLLQGFAGSPGRMIWRIGEDLRLVKRDGAQYCDSLLGPAPVYIGGEEGLGGCPSSLGAPAIGGEFESNSPSKGELE